MTQLKKDKNSQQNQLESCSEPRKGVQMMQSLLPFVALLASGLTCQSPQDVQKDWWETAQFYQIYPRSFKDSNGDGIGDLNGITEKLDHLKDLGVSATWLSPIFKSPMADFGYDISDFYSIQTEYGTMEDFEKLITKAKQLGIKVILDFVPNHSSDENEWFTKSVNRDPEYEDFYVWHPGKPDPNNATNRLPPSNWLQAFRGSAWQWNDQRQEFYLHQFAVKQPDLNYRNPAVVQRMKDVLTFWLNKGVDGFRVDAVPWVFEVAPDENQNYPDEPTSGFTDDPEEAAYLKHIYTQDQPETVDMVFQWRKLLDDYKAVHGGDTRVLLTETYSAIDVVVQYYGNATHNGAHVPFNFNFITKTNGQSSARDLANVISLWFNKMPRRSGFNPNWVLGNHDQRRVGSRYGKERIDQMNMIAMMLPGVGISYNGEEIGMLDVDISWEDSRDPAACNSNPDIYQKFTRDPERTPFQWDDTKNAGFSTADKTWLPVASNYMEVNVKAQTQATRSHLKVYKDLINLRKTTTLKYGSLKHKALNDDVLALERQLPGDESFVLIANIGSTKQNVSLKEFAGTLPTTLRCRIVNVESKREVGATVTAASVELDPYESIVLSGK